MAVILSPLPLTSPAYILIFYSIVPLLVARQICYTKSGFSSFTPSIVPIGGNYIGSVALYGTDAVTGYATLTQDNGGAFTLQSIDVADFFVNAAGVLITFTGTRQGGGTVTQTYTHGTNNKLETVVFGSDFSNLVAVGFNQDFPANQFDNIVVIPAAVPEPGSIALLVGIFVTGAGFVRKRRARA